MYSFVNDLSISPEGVSVTDNWGLIDTVMSISFKLRDFKIEKIRVPPGFIDLPVADGLSIRNYLNDSEFDNDKKTLLYDFLQNRMEEPDNEITVRLENAQIDKLIDVCCQDKSSVLLTEAYIMNCVALSFETSPVFQYDFLDGVLTILYDSDKVTHHSIKIGNIFSQAGVNIHHPFLVEWKRIIVFAKTKWNPVKQPIWNNLTPEALKKADFPKSIEKKVDKKEELRRIGTLVAEMNAWIFDEAITKKNKNAGQLRKIFRSDSGSKTAYLSIDFENPYGGFEVHDHKGAHQGQIDFLGKYNKEPDSKGYHDIKI